MTDHKRPQSPARSPWWMPHVHADRRPLLLARNAIKAGLRAWFESQGFLEVEPGCLQVSPGNETHLHAFKTEHVGTDLARHEMYLQTSPEFAMKKLLASGEEKIFAFAPAFRNRERGPLHAPEFTMLEWYRTGADAETLWQDCIEILRLAATVTKRQHWNWRGRSCDALAAHGFTTLDQAFAQFAGIALEETYNAGHADRDGLALRAASIGIQVATDDTWSDIFSKVLTGRIEPGLGSFRPEFLHAYPHHEAALARRVAGNPALAERFELYVCGVELANGFGELTDAREQRRRFMVEMAEKERIYGERYPIDEDFLAALATMPDAAGCALGFDRLVLLATGASHIDEVLWTPLPSGE
jgi:elongation factor P--(R)-beta-lysine ligase